MRAASDRNKVRIPFWTASRTVYGTTRSFLLFVCCFQFRFYPIIYLLCDRPGMKDPIYRKYF